MLLFYLRPRNNNDKLPEVVQMHDLSSIDFTLIVPQRYDFSAYDKHMKHFYITISSVILLLAIGCTGSGSDDSGYTHLHLRPLLRLLLLVDAYVFDVVTYSNYEQTDCFECKKRYICGRIGKHTQK